MYNAINIFKKENIEQINNQLEVDFREWINTQKKIVKNKFALKINTISQNTSFSTYLGQINGRIAGWSTIKKVCLFKKICFGIHRTGVGGLVDWDLCSIIKKHANFRHILQKVCRY